MLLGWRTAHFSKPSMGYVEQSYQTPPIVLLPSTVSDDGPVIGMRKPDVDPSVNSDPTSNGGIVYMGGPTGNPDVGTFNADNGTASIEDWQIPDFRFTDENGQPTNTTWLLILGAVGAFIFMGDGGGGGKKGKRR